MSTSPRKTEAEVILILLLFAVLIALIMPMITHSPRHRGSISKCKSNLRQLGVAMQLYSDTYGPINFDGKRKTDRYAPFAGAEFWTHLYRTGVLTDAEVYLCPGTIDDNDDGRALNKPGAPHPMACSYGGRINYLGHPARIFTGRNASDTPIGCDDDEGEFNHPESVIILYLDNSTRDLVFSDSYKDPLLGGARIGAGILSVCTN